ncbi:MAG: integrin alpha [Pseudomonadota bacterium]
MLNGEAVRDYSGISVSAASDINADGIDDLFIGASGADSNGVNFSGRSYVVFGSRNGFPNPFSIGDLDWSNGIIINGAAGDNSGRSISVAGDVNDDGIDDLMIGAYLADINGKTAMGRAYILFGSNNSFAHPLNLSNINGLNGLVIDGEAQGDGLSRSISAAGDINHDGIDDLIIGADGADPNGNNLSGRSYVVFGSDSDIVRLSSG